MGSINNVLKMLFLLKVKGTLKAKDLASELEVSEREVRRYKETLDEFFQIDSISGKYGGYRLSENVFFPFKEVLSENEVNLLKQFINGLDSNYLENNKEIISAINKINYTILNKDNHEELVDTIIPYSRVKDLDNKTKIMLEDIGIMIFECKEIIIEYKGNNGKVTERRVQPYEFLTYKGEKYLVAFCLLRKEVRFFKIRRIINLIKTEVKFERKINMKELLEEYKKSSIGIFGGKKYDLVLEIKYPMANTIKERIWVDNQIIDDTTYEDKIIFKSSMTGGPEIESWILSMGECVKIIEPLELKTKIQDKLKNMIKNI